MQVTRKCTAIISVDYGLAELLSYELKMHKDDETGAEKKLFRFEQLC